MDTLNQIEGIQEAIAILRKAAGQTASGGLIIYRIVDHAIKHLDNQVPALLAA